MGEKTRQTWCVREILEDGSIEDYSGFSSKYAAKTAKNRMVWRLMDGGLTMADAEARFRIVERTQH